MDQFKVSIYNVEPPHRANNAEKLALLTASMEGGWQGRPLVLLEGGAGGWFAWTGSHRIQAARDAGLEEVPAVLLDNELWNMIDEELGNIWDRGGHQPTDLESWASQICAILRREGFDEAACLIEEEHADA